MRSGLILALSLVLTSCAREAPDVPVPPAPPNAFLAGVSVVSDFDFGSVSNADAASALASFVESCPKLLSREDASGLTVNADWSQACSAAKTWPENASARFFTSELAPVRVGEGRAFATGYFEPEIMGSLTEREGYVPIYAMPTDLVRAWPADVPESEREGRPPLGRYDESGNFVLYFERSEIVAGALDDRAEILAWAADPIEFFFLQIQGSGRLRTPEGDVIRIGYAGQNGREYVGIGRVMREQGLIGDGTPYSTSMQGIIAYLRDNPAKGEEIMNLNKSWIFFRVLEGDGPLGSLEVPVRAGSSVAADPKFVPLGAPVWLDLDRDEADGLWVAQDTGGAIKGANRFDTFWGAGDEAREIAGGMLGRGDAVIFLPKSAVDRLTADK